MIKNLERIHKFKNVNSTKPFKHHATTLVKSQHWKAELLSTQVTTESLSSLLLLGKIVIKITEETKLNTSLSIFPLVFKLPFI